MVISNGLRAAQQEEVIDVLCAAKPNGANNVRALTEL
jgi:hypothetical protein